jgi:hypothetical protein
VDPIPDPLLLRKSGSSGNRTRDLWLCSQELWPQDHRGGQCKQLDWFILKCLLCWWPAYRILLSLNTVEYIYSMQIVIRPWYYLSTLCYFPLTWTSNERCIRLYLTMPHVKYIYRVTLVSLPPHKFAWSWPSLEIHQPRNDRIEQVTKAVKRQRANRFPNMGLCRSTFRSPKIIRMD